MSTQKDAEYSEADLLSDHPELSALKDKMDIVSIRQVLHSWDWEGQIKAARALLAFTKPGSMIVGNQRPRCQEYNIPPINNPAYRHNPETLEKFWNQAASETGTKLETQAWMRSFDMDWEASDGKWMEPGVAIIEFAVRRIE